MGPENLPNPLMCLLPGPRCGDTRCALGWDAWSSGRPTPQRGRSTGRPPSTQTHPSTQRLWGPVEETACSRPGSGEAPAAGRASEPSPRGRPRLPALLTPSPGHRALWPARWRGCPPLVYGPCLAAGFAWAGRCPLPPTRCCPQLTSSQPGLSQGQAPTRRNGKPGQVPCRCPGKSPRSPTPARHFHEAQFSRSRKGDFSLLRTRESDRRPLVWLPGEGPLAAGLPEKRQGVPCMPQHGALEPHLPHTF